MQIAYQVSSALLRRSCVGVRLRLFLEDDAGDTSQERGSLLWSGKDAGRREKKVRLVKAALYAVQVFYSFFIM